MTDYSGRTTSHSHKFSDWKSKPSDGEPPFQEAIIFEVQWSLCPIEVETEVVRLWTNYELGNDHSFILWQPDHMSSSYPLIAEYISNNCPTTDKPIYIHWWW